MTDNESQIPVVNNLSIQHCNFDNNIHKKSIKGIIAIAQALEMNAKALYCLAETFKIEPLIKFDRL